MSRHAPLVSLLTQYESRHGVRRQIGRISLGAQPHQDVADRRRSATDGDALQRAVAPAIEIRSGFHRLLAGHGFVHLQPADACRGDAHRRERVVVAGHAARLLQERDIGLLQQRQAALHRHPGRRRGREVRWCGLARTRVLGTGSSQQPHNPRVTTKLGNAEGGLAGRALRIHVGTA